MVATKKMTFQKTVDDAMANLCEARFFSMPLDYKSLGQNMPTNITPVNTVVDMSHIGVDITNTKTL